MISSIKKRIGIKNHPDSYTINNFMMERNKSKYQILFFDDSPENFISIKNGFEISDLDNIARSILVPQTNKIRFDSFRYITQILPDSYRNVKNNLSLKDYIHNMTLFINYSNFGFGEFDDIYVNALTISHLHSIIEWANLPNPTNKKRVVIFDFDELLNRTSGPYFYDYLFPIVEKNGTPINYFTSENIRINDIIQTINMGNKKTRLPEELNHKVFTIRPSLLAAYYLFGSKERFDKIHEMFHVLERNNIKFYILTNNGFAQSSRCFVEILREVHPSFSIRSDPSMRIHGVTSYNSNRNKITHMNNPYKITAPIGYFSKDGNIIASRRYFGERHIGGDKYVFLLSYFRNMRSPEKISLNKLYNGTKNANSPEEIEENVGFFSFMRRPKTSINAQESSETSQTSQISQTSENLSTDKGRNFVGGKSKTTKAIKSKRTKKYILK